MKFKVGDNVKIVKVKTDNIKDYIMSTLNKKGRILEVDNDKEYPYLVEFYKNGCGYYDEDELELIK